MTTSLCHTEIAGAASCHVALDETGVAAATPDLATLHCQLSDVIRAGSFADLLERLAPVFATTLARFVVVCEHVQDSQAAVSVHTLFAADDTNIGAWEPELLNIARQVVSEGHVQVWRDSGCLIAWAVPGLAGHCLVALFPSPAPVSQTALLTLEAVTLQFAAWRAARETDARETAAQRLAALTELLSRLKPAETLPEACRLLVDELQSYLGCEQVVVGMCREGSSRCRVEAISGIDAFHPHSDEARAAQGALQEAIARGDMSLWPARDDGSRSGLKAHEQFASSIDAEVVVGSSLRDERGEVRGAWLFAGTAAKLYRDDVLALLDAAGSPVASTLALLARAQPGWSRRLSHGLTRLIRRRRGQAILAAVAAAVALLLVPVPHRVKCDCQLEPVTRRFVAAPFDGPLKETLVEPGDLVTAGQLLARMDGREVRWELAGVQSELFRAAKQRAGHVASHEAGAAEVARHEVDRLQYREQLLMARDKDLEIRSPVDGLVVSGDLKDAEGIPLTVGEVLFEVAPLDTMIVELAVPEDDVTYVRDGMPVRIVFDAYPFRSYATHIERLHPRAEIRDEQNVFIAEVPLDNPRQKLHPGMRGHARIAAGKSPLGWILFRRPWAAALEWMGW